MAGRIFITKYQGQADHKVYFTDYEGQQKNAELLRGCTLTDYEGQADLKVYITEYQGQASIIITRKNFPR